MNRRQRTYSLPMLILLGVLAGILILIIDQWRSSPTSPEPSPLPTRIQSIQVQPTAVSALANTPIPNSFAGTNTITDASLFIPSAGVIAPIIRVYLSNGTWDVDDLGDNVGHLEGTNWVDSGPGNIVLSGHVELRDGRGGVFGQIENLAIGALMELTVGDAVRRYSVTEIYRVEPDDISPIYPTISDRLTLITCDAYDFFSNTYTERVIVVAERMS